MKSLDEFDDLDERFHAVCEAVVSEVKNRQANCVSPLVVAIDGASGSGKSTLARLIAEELNAALIPLDDFFSGHIPDQKWDQFTVAERYERVFDWERVRREVIEPLLEGKPARWHAFDFASGLRADGTFGMEAQAKEREPADVIVIEGAYSAGPHLSDLIDLAVLIDVSVEERRARLHEREDAEFQRAWHARWDKVEAYYWREVKPRSTYDLVFELV